jgi:nodulation protein E
LVTDFDPETRFESRLHQGLDRNAQFALAAAEEAIGDSGLVFGEGLGARTGVITGSGIGGSQTMDAAYERLYRQGKRRTSPMTVPNIMPSSGASHISMAHGLRGPSFTISSACASSSHAIGIALSLIRWGSADVIVAGGHESQLNHASLYAWDALRVVSPTSCRPFSRERDGMILGEGGAMLVLESLEHALGRGARIYAELSGFGMTADAHHLTAPSVEGPVSAMRIALDDAGLGADGIDYVNAHGTGTESNDLNEARAIHGVFGARAREIAVGSTKSMHGHTLGAAGAIEAVATILAMHHGTVPPTPGADPIDPDIALKVIADAAHPMAIRAAMSNSFAFGGLNAVLVFRSPGDCGS